MSEACIQFYMSKGVPFEIASHLCKTKYPSASQNTNFPYVQTERPRFLEEGLPIPPDYMLWLFIAYNLKKNPEMLEKLALKWMDTQQHIISSLAQAGAGNLITAYSHSFLIALMLEQNYMIRQRGSDDLIASLNWLTGAVELASLVTAFSVPATLVFAGMGGTFPTGTAGVLAALRSIKTKEAGKKSKEPSLNVPLSLAPTTP